MRVTGICSSRGSSRYSARVGDGSEMEKRLGVDLVAWRIDDGPLELGSVRVLRRSVSPAELEQAEATFVGHAVVTIEVVRRMVGPGEELLAKAGSSRWEFADSFSFGPAEDVDLGTIAGLLISDESTRTKRELVVLEEPVTPVSFYRGIHPSHARTSDQVYDGTPNEQSTGLAHKVDEAEQRLGVVLPSLLRQLYLVQNGGYVNSICVPDPNEANHYLYSHVTDPFGGYEALYPTETLRTVYDSFLDFGDPDDESYGSYFRPGVEKMVILAQYYQETLFLDYREPGAVPVRVVDFANEGWPDRLVSWDSFDDFFAALRHYETF